MITGALYMNVTVDVGSLLGWILMLAAIVAVIFLTILIVKLIQLLDPVGKLVADLKEPLTKTVNELPDTMSNVASIVKEANETVPSILKDAAKTTEAVGETVVKVSDTADKAVDALAGFVSPKRKKEDTVSNIATIVGTIIGIASELFGSKGK